MCDDINKKYNSYLKLISTNKYKYLIKRCQMLKSDLKINSNIFCYKLATFAVHLIYNAITCKQYINGKSTKTCNIFFQQINLIDY